MLVSVIMPTYNCGRFIEESVLSVIAQTVTDWEICIADDCSTDNTLEVLKPYLEKYPNIHYYCLEKNGGPAAARNAAIERAKGKYLAFLDSDDLWTPDKLERQIALMEKHNAVFSCSAFRQMDEDGTLQDIVRVPPAKTDYNTMLRLSNPIGNSTVMYDRELLGHIRVPDIKKRNDFALWLKILRVAPICVGTDEILGIYRVRKSSVSSNKRVLAKYHWKLYREIEQLSPIRSLWAMFCWAGKVVTHRGIKKIPPETK